MKNYCPPRLTSPKNPKGFTLIELLIVIVIIGVLLGTLLPNLIGARERSEDLRVRVGMTQIAQALESYYTDFGQYPGTAGTGECLQSGQAVHDLLLGDYLAEVPSALENGVTDFDGVPSCTGSIGYAPLVANGIANNGYILAADVQLVQNANLVSTDIDDAGEILATTSEDNIQTLIDATVQADLDLAEGTDPSTTIFVLVSN